MPKNRNILTAAFTSMIFIGGATTGCSQAESPSSSPVSSPAAETVAPTTSAAASYPAPPVPEQPGAKCHMRGQLPDPECTPGAINPNVTQANIHQTICVSGFTKTIRPPESYTNRLKAEQMVEYGFTDSIHAHEEDHLISLELGGSPDDPHNLWPEPDSSPNPKDKVEDLLHRAVCAGRVSLHEAQVRIATDWTAAGNGL